MSAVCILTPVVIAAWPAFTAAVVAAASSLGYTVMDQALDALSTQSPQNRVQLEIPQSELITDRLARAKEIRVSRDGVTITFSRDARGRASVCVTGEGRSKQDLQALGTELAGRVVQHYVYQRLKEEMAARQFLLVEEETDATAAIRLKVRHWEN